MKKPRFWHALRWAFYRRWTGLFGRRRGVYYINGPDVLPAPLSQEREAAYIARIEEEESRSVLIEHNLRLVVYIAKRFESSGVMMEDLISIGTIGLIKAVNTFDLEKNKFLKYFSLKI